MGKRKERRVAARIGAGRRVKLDLFAEPSGDLGGSSAQEEAGGNEDSNNRAGLPNSPSSSGQQPENPLFLLEQYSNDELDEESSELNHASVEDSPSDLEDQVKLAAGKDDKDETHADKDLDAQKVEQLDMENGSPSLDGLQKLEENDGDTENDATRSGDLHREMESTEQIPVPATSDIVGDVSLGWKIVLHEESKQYYYWNTVTGETSWEVPNVLAKGPALSCEEKTVNDTEGIGNGAPGTYKSSSTLDMELDKNGYEAANLACENNEIHEQSRKLELFNEGCENNILDDKESSPDASHSCLKNSSDPISALYHVNSSGDYVFPRQSGDALLGMESASGADSEKYIDDIGDHGKHETDLSSRLVRHGEYLLEKLNSLKGSKVHLQSHDMISKYILEVEIRLSDIKSLLSHGSLLLPFWLHSERQLKQLEGAVKNEIFHFNESAESSEVEAHKSHENGGDDIKVDSDGMKTVSSTSQDSFASKFVGVKTEVQKDSYDKAYIDGFVNSEHIPSIGYPTTTSSSGAGGKVEVHGVAMHAEVTPKTELHYEEDIDMDVDMEVEDAIPASNTTAGDVSVPQCFAPPVQPIPPNSPAEYQSFAPEEVFGVPPPPDEDWIPPPPPDNELFPPPPPDEPPESSYPPPPSDPETVQAISYTDQYNPSYAGSNFEYYVQTNTEVPCTNFYAHTEGFQIAVSHPPIYYEAVANTYAAAAPIVVNPVQSAAYYHCLQDGTVPPVPLEGGVDSSGFHSKMGHESLGSDQIGLFEAQSSLPNTQIDVSTVGLESEKPSVGFTPAPAFIQVPATISVTECVALSSTPAVTATSFASTVTVPKPESKVSRKKRTVAVVSTLRSNKKVSSLVDKWKAAKEEMHENEEDEPENSFEMLEKKRQREIEEWRAQQIASGEATYNANFQPLGGNWRERVKRRRAQLENKAALETQSEDVTLNELSKDLPPGWQAYWDESSKQVYYGNVVKSETTWIRPTN